MSNQDTYPAGQFAARCLRDTQLSVHRPGVVDWCESHRYIPAEAGSAIPGRWRCSYTPYLREILECLHEDSGVNKIVLCKGAQVGFTVGVLENAILYCIGAAPSTIMYATATEQIFKKRMQLNIEPAIDNAGLRGYLRPQVRAGNSRARASGDKVEMKQFAGGYFIGSSLQAASHARSFSVQYLLLDEVDSAPTTVKDEGDIIRLFIARTRAYGNSRKVFIGSTPRIKQTSRIWQHYLDGDQRKYFVPCKKCGEMQFLVFENLIFKDRRGKWVPEMAYYKCAICGAHWNESDKAKALDAGEWRPTAKPVERGSRSYHLSTLYAHPALYQWERVAADYIEAWKYSRRGDQSALRDFNNTQLGEPWEEQGYAPNPQMIELTTRNARRRGTYPREVIFLTMGVDVQGDRIEAELLGWCLAGITYSIDYFVLTRNKKQDSAYAMLADLLTPILDKNYMRNRAPLIHTCIDANYASADVYSYCQDSEYVVTPIIGRASTMEKFTGLFKPDEMADYGGMVRAQLNVDLLKGEVYNNLRKEGRTKPHGEQMPYTCNFPSDYPSDYYKQLTAEQQVLVETPKTRQRVMRWYKLYHKNEALDCRVYAVAAMHIFAHQTCVDGWGLEKTDYEAFFEWAADNTNTG